MIDTHCHLTDPRLRSQLAGVLLRAKAAGVDRIITVGTDIKDDRDAVALCRGRDDLRCAIGIHPNHCKDADAADVGEVSVLQADPSVVAIGETGLDYHYGSDDKAKQADFFRAQLRLAVEVDKPAVIHCREANADCLAILREFPTVRVVFHCFTGLADEARRIVEDGHWISYTGAVTFKNAASVREAVRLTPRDRLMLETDAPYLSPEPMRKQKVNEPALVVHTAGVVAGEWGVDVAELDRITTANAARFFGWP